MIISELRRPQRGDHLPSTNCMGDESTLLEYCGQSCPPKMRCSFLVFCPLPSLLSKRSLPQPPSRLLNEVCSTECLGPLCPTHLLSSASAQHLVTLCSLPGSPSPQSPQLLIRAAHLLLLPIDDTRGGPCREGTWLTTTRPGGGGVSQDSK